MGDLSFSFAKMPIILGNESFSYKNFRKRYKQMLASGITEDNRKFALDCALRHPYNRDQGAPLQEVRVVQSQHMLATVGQMELQGVWGDLAVPLGEKTNWRGEHDQNYQQRRAFRDEVRDQIKDHQDADPTYISGVYELEHEGVGFAQLRDDFLATEQVKDWLVKREGYDQLFVDRTFAQRWKDYHKKHAKLQTLTKEEHRVKTAREAHC